MQKFYAVRRGKNPGIYSTWLECQAQVDNFPDNEYRSFASLAEAQAYLYTPSEPSGAPSDAPLVNVTIPFDTLVAYIGGCRSGDSLGFGIVYQATHKLHKESEYASFSRNSCSHAARWAPYLVGCFYAIQSARAEHFQKLIIVTNEKDLKLWTKKEYGAYTKMVKNFKVLLHSSQHTCIIFSSESADAWDFGDKSRTLARDAAEHGLNPIHNPLI